MTSSISLKNTMNTKDLEWFGPPERNTLRPLYVVLLCLERVCECLGEPVCVIWGACPVQRALLFYISREARTWPLGPRQMGPTMQYKIMYCSYIMALQAKEISSPDFPGLSVGIFRLACFALSCRNGARV